jgi:protein-L-isoaspartate(D-aspartate) O-methyltransferase
MNEQDKAKKSQKLVDELKQQGIVNAQVLEAFQKVPRELFVSDHYQTHAYANAALPIECEQTISQPYIVALMTQALLARSLPTQKVLEIGTGSGYQAAILAHLVAEVYTIERYEFLYRQAQSRFQQLDLNNIVGCFADGLLGWQAQAPFDGIIVTAACPQIPLTLLQQLAPKGRLIAPVGDYGKQRLICFEREGDEFQETCLEQVVFVPMGSGEVAMKQ